MNFYDKSVQETLKILETSEEGLTSKEANKRLEKYGANELPRPAEESIFHLFISQFENPIELILVMTVVFSFIANTLYAKSLTDLLTLTILLSLKYLFISPYNHRYSIGAKLYILPQIKVVHRLY